MGTVLASKIAADAADLLFDKSMTRFGTSYLQWINDAHVMIVALKPDANAAPVTVSLVAGVYQQIPETAHAMIKPIRNMGIGGATPGAVVKTADYEHFTMINPAWMDVAAAATVQVVMIDDHNERGFFCYPQQPATGQGSIQALCSAIPDKLTALTQAIKLNDIYEPHILRFLMWRGNSVSTSAVSKATAANEWNMFVTGLGRKDMIDQLVGPNTARRKMQGGVNVGQAG